MLSCPVRPEQRSAPVFIIMVRAGKRKQERINAKKQPAPVIKCESALPEGKPVVSQAFASGPENKPCGSQ